MSWFAGALGTAGVLSDIAGAIGNVVTQQQVVRNQAKQLELYQQAIDKNLKLQHDIIDANVMLATEGPTLQYNAARKVGYNHFEALALTGTHRISYGGVNVEPRALPSMPFYNQGTNLRTAAFAAANSFKTGTAGATRPAPAGFSNPSYGVVLKNYTQMLDHNPGSSVV